jgi:hypothetical protein
MASNLLFTGVIRCPQSFAPTGMAIAPKLVVTRVLGNCRLLKGGKPMLWTILVILLVLWLLGFIGHIGGGLIHLLLVLALIVFIINIVSGRRTV